MALRDLLDVEEGVFRALLAGWQRLRPSRAPDAGSATFEDEARSLSVLAQLLTGESVRLRRARGVGGVRGAELMLPATLAVWKDLEENRAAYRVQVVVASGMRRLTRGRPAPRADRYEGALEMLRVAAGAVELMAGELPGFRTAHDRVMAKVLESRLATEAGRLRGREACLERARRAALEGVPVWEDADDRATLTGPRAGRHRSPDLPIWGSWLDTPGEVANAGSPEASPSSDEPSTELDAPDVDALRVVELDAQAARDPVPTAPFERAESLDSHRGGGHRNLDGTDELEEHLEALDQVELGDLFRGSQSAQSLLKADLDLGLEVADLEDGPGVVRGIAYDEWDGRKRVYRRDWCTVFPDRAERGDARWAARCLVTHRRLVRDLRHRLEVHRAGLRPAPRQLDGEDIDLAAAVDDTVARRAGRSSDPRLYIRSRRRRRDFATSVLLDVSMSTDSWIDGRCILEVAREATLVLGEVAHQLGDRIQVLAFASETRNRCHVWEVLDFGGRWDDAKLRLASLRPTGYTRIGPALRHASALLAAEPAERRLLLLISDGKPTDYDRYEGRYGIADVRQALREAEAREIHTHALAIDTIARDYLPALFGEGGWDILPKPDQLVEALTAVYGRLTAR
ncbi:MAG: nitric oxide reductase activation protein NorD [Myxococcota bacterium]